MSALRPLSILSIAALIACGGSATTDSQPEPAPASEEAQIEAAVRKHLARRSDLDMTAMDMTIERVDVQGDTADATVGFRVKNTPEAAMSMDYRLIKQAGEWTVQPNAAAGHGAAPPAPAPETAPKQDLPPGHPPVAQ